MLQADMQFATEYRLGHRSRKVLEDDLGTLVLFGRPKHRIGLLQLRFELFEFSLFFNRFSLGVVRRTEFLVDGLSSKGHLFEQTITFCTTI